MIVMLDRLWQRLGLTDVRLEINSLGQSHERAAHREALIAYLEQHQDILDDDAKRDRKSTRLNSSHVAISYAVFCLKKKKQTVRRRGSTLSWNGRPTRRAS